MKKMLAVMIVIVGLATAWSCLAQVVSTPEGDFVTLENEYFVGNLWTNGSPETWNKHTPMKNGFRQFYNRQNLQDSMFNTAFYFEHIYNGTLRDDWRAFYAPEKTPCHINQLSANSGQLIWYGDECLANQGWDIDCVETFTLNGQALDLHFQAVIQEEDVAPLGYLAFMWASYVNQLAVEKNIHFFGLNRDNIIGWQSLGTPYEVDDGYPSRSHVDIGPSGYIGTRSLTCEIGATSINVGDTGFHFIHPFYYAFLDGDRSLNTTEDTIIFLAMFDSSDIRLTMFDPIQDTHSPALDWQYIVRNPQVRQVYGYNARFMFVPIEQILIDVPNREELTTNPPQELNDWVTQSWKNWLPPNPVNSPPGIVFSDKDLDRGLKKWSLPQGAATITLPSAIAGDDLDGDITATIQIDSSRVNLNQIGQYPVYYQVTDSGGLSNHRLIEIEIVDNTPSIWLDCNCFDLMVLLPSSSFTPPPANAFDPYHGDLTDLIKIISNDVKSNILGEYQVVYSVTNPNGKTATKTLTVKVVEDQPHLNINDSNPLLWQKDTAWVRPTATAWDDFYGDLTKDIVVVSDNVNSQKLGNYQVVYSVTNPNGKTVTTTLKVIVIPKFVYWIIFLLFMLIKALIG